MNVVLIGYRGTGKSTVARLLAEQTGRRLVSTDEEIVRRVGCSIADYVNRHGWERFRDVESEVAREVGALDDTVIDAGGGIILRPENVAALKTKGPLIWLRAEPATIANRIKDSADRPSLTGAKTFLEEIAEVLETRTPLYQAAADLTIDTDNRSPEEVACEIVRIMPRQPSSR
ncbi:MAG: shikimate kinase [Candidatus Hydrogenedentes bacterium]|nr:shikimate kinase [Candidatus Hydrogenedentota bacterium]